MQDGFLVEGHFYIIHFHFLSLFPHRILIVPSSSLSNGFVFDRHRDRERETQNSNKVSKHEEGRL